MIRPLAATIALAAACAPEPDDPPAVPELAAEFDLGLLPASTRVAHLAWHPPSCPAVYRVRVDETFPPGLEEFLKTREEHSTSYFALDPAPSGAWPEGPVPQDRVFAGGLVFVGPRSANRPLRRDFALSAALAGPASPDAACFERTWDAVEDSLALGWPQLTGRLTAVGEEWSGARVESRCNRSACVDPETRGGGPTAHHLPCVTPSWHEQLDGVAELTSRPSGPDLAPRPSGPDLAPRPSRPDLGPLRVAVISSAWSDGHPVGEGLSSERTAVISVDHGRLLYAHARVHHGYMGVERDIRIDAVDACPGGLVAAGWDPPEPVVTAREAILADREKTAKKGR